MYALERTYRARPEVCSCSPMLRGQPSPTRKDQLPVRTLQGVLVLSERPSVACSALVFPVTSPDGVADSKATLRPDTHYVPVLLCSLACHGILKSAGSHFFLFTLKFFLYSFFVIFLT